MKYRDDLIKIIENSDITIQRLESVKSLSLEHWCIGAGAIRNLVWDHLHNLAEPSLLTDVDVAFFDPFDISQKQDDDYLLKLKQLDPDTPWEVTNQAGVHLWFEPYFGSSVDPLTSLTEAVSTWPEYATCVAAYIDVNNTIQIIAPYGLEDLFNIHVRRNPSRVSIEVYEQRVKSKNYNQRWPNAQIFGLN